VFKKVFGFFIFSNIFIALCAAIMACQTKYFIQLHTQFFQLQLFLFFSTLASYSFHWYLTQIQQTNTSVRIVWLLQHRKFHLYFFCFSFIGSAILLLSFAKYWQWFLPAILLTFLYSAPKLPFPFFQSTGKLIVAKTLLLSIVWTYVTTVLPFIIYGGTWQQSYTGFSLYRFTFITAVCILFDVRDKDYDVEAGIQNMVTWFPLKIVKTIFWIMIVLNIATIGMIFLYNTSRISLLTMLIPTIVLTILFNPALKTNNDYLFYFVLDGLMALSAILFCFQL
jgi:hypothetical protein